MVRGGRRVGMVMAAALMVAGMAGCAPFDDRPVQVAEPMHAKDCVVGSWKQTEGWQRLVTSSVVSDLVMLSGGRQFEIKADGTANARYTDPTKWESPGFSEKIEVLYAGTLTMTYTIDNANWTETANATKATTQVTIDGKPELPVPGPASRVTKATFVCDQGNLILTADNFRQAFKRA